MTSKDFIIWLKGFSEGVHQYNITPVQWETLKEQLNKVDDTPYVSDNFTIGPEGAYERDPNQPSFKVNDQGFYQNPHRTVYPNWSGINPYGSITTTPGCSSITIANPPFGFGTTSTATSLPSGSTISYTNSTDKTLLND